MEAESTYTAFNGERLIVTGGLQEMLIQTKACLDQQPDARVLIFEDQSGRQIDFDFRGTPEDVLSRLAAHPLFASSATPEPARSGPGRPRLGVVSREVSLLPRHWEWLEQQSGGISAALRRLVDQARKSGQGQELAKRAWEAAGKFMWVMAGSLENFEEASRALYNHDQERLSALIAEWPNDIREHVNRLVSTAAQLDLRAGWQEPAR